MANCRDWKQEIKESQNFICPFCGLKGTKESLNIHHLHARSRGGKNNPENVIATHITCHREYHKKYGRRTSDMFGNPIDSGGGWICLGKKSKKTKKVKKVRRNRRHR